MDINQQLRQEWATACGFVLLEDDRLTAAVREWENLRDDQFGDEDMPGLAGAYPVTVTGDDDPTNPMIAVIGMCVKHPGRKTWAVVWGQVINMETAYWFPVDTIDEALKTVQNGIKSLS